MTESVFQSRLRAGVGGPDLWKLRKQTAFDTTQAFVAVGRAMASRTDLTGDDGEAVRAMGALLQMAGELGLAASRMLSGEEHYAGAALLRQIVEIEYLTWTFKEGHESITAWLNSTHRERMQDFPRRNCALIQKVASYLKIIKTTANRVGIQCLKVFHYLAVSKSNRRKCC